MCFMSTDPQSMPVSTLAKGSPSKQTATEALAYATAILATVRSPLLVLQPDHRIKTCNQAFASLFQAPKGQIEGQFFFEILGGVWRTPEIRDQVENAVLSKDQTTEKEVELTCVFPSFGERSMILHVTPLLQERETEPLLLVSFEDLTERRKDEQMSRWITAVVESSEVAIISKDLNGVIMSANPGATRLFGYTREEFIGKPMTMLIPPHLHFEETNILQRIKGGQRVEHFETVRRHKDGHLLNVSLTVSPVKDLSGRVIGASKIAQDITQRKLVEQKLAESYQREKEARESAENANRAKDQFLASLSHELRTPLNPVLLIASDAAVNPALPESIRKDFETIRFSVELEARLIDDLLDLTRIKHGKLRLLRKTWDVHDLLQKTMTSLGPEALKKSIHIERRFMAATSFVEGDEVRLQQVFGNILNNALKFTPSGGRVSVVTSNTNSLLQISISDSGIGMTEIELQSVFGVFAQGDHANESTHRFGGLGLGLAISRQLIEMHEGKVCAASEGRGKGSTFTVEIPLAKEVIAETSDEVMRLPSPAMPSLRMLLVEDHEPTRTALETLLVRRKHSVVAVSNCAEALNADLGELDVVISDIGLPDGNGNELMRKLRDKFGIPGIALTGYGMEEDIQQCLAAGFVGHLTKPINIRTLENMLAKIVSDKQAR